ncbi:MAG: ATP synthase F1 subunit epsilon [Spirochaetaceae bacterium]|jgi:F-type H+-transporting ATPase subunit epsilon|nr:ATP synthase F1 subunit epsilon [Spirochaetaceae bacterium]
MNLYTLEVHTPYRLFFKDSVVAVVLRLIDGEIGIYAGHSPFTAPVCTGILKIQDAQGQWREAFTTEGILEVTHHKTVLLVDAAEWPEEIDCQRARLAKTRAQERLAAMNLHIERESAKALLKRAEFRLKVSELHRQGGKV